MHKMVKPAGIFILLVYYYAATAQVMQLFTGTNTNLRNISIIGGNILLNGEHNYLVKSTNACKDLTSLYSPGLVSQSKYLQRLDSNTLFLLSNKLYSGSSLYKSINTGVSWTKILDTTGVSISEAAFFDDQEGIVSRHTHFITTNNGGKTWNYGTISIKGNTTLPYLYPLVIHGNNMVCLGLSSGSFMLSKNRGQTWPYAGYLNSAPADFCFANKDSIFALSISGEIAKSTNGGISWKNFKLPLDSTKKIHHHQSIIYVLGADTQNTGTILKSQDFGLSWSRYSTGVKTKLLNMAMLNDSIALLTGTNGVLLKWNYTQSVFTGLVKISLPFEKLTVYPNPVQDKLYLEYEPEEELINSIRIINSLGQEIAAFSKPAKFIELSTLSPGIYYLKTQRDSQQQIIKLVKE